MPGQTFFIALPIPLDPLERFLGSWTSEGVFRRIALELERPLAGFDLLEPLLPCFNVGNEDSWIGGIVDPGGGLFYNWHYGKDIGGILRDGLFKVTILHRDRDRTYPFVGEKSPEDFHRFRTWKMSEGFKSIGLFVPKGRGLNAVVRGPDIPIQGIWYKRPLLGPGFLDPVAVVRCVAGDGD